MANLNLSNLFNDYKLQDSIVHSGAILQKKSSNHIRDFLKKIFHALISRLNPSYYPNKLNRKITVLKELIQAESVREVEKFSIEGLWVDTLKTWKQAFQKEEMALNNHFVQNFKLDAIGKIPWYFAQIRSIRGLIESQKKTGPDENKLNQSFLEFIKKKLKGVQSLYPINDQPISNAIRAKIELSLEKIETLKEQSTANPNERKMLYEQFFRNNQEIVEQLKTYQSLSQQILNPIEEISKEIPKGLDNLKKKLFDKFKVEATQSIVEKFYTETIEEQENQLKGILSNIQEKDLAGQPLGIDASLIKQEKEIEKNLKIKLLWIEKHVEIHVFIKLYEKEIAPGLTGYDTSIDLSQLSLACKNYYAQSLSFSTKDVDRQYQKDLTRIKEQLRNAEGTIAALDLSKVDLMNMNKDEAFLASIKAEGFSHVKVENDGSCLFHALFKGLLHLKIAENIEDSQKLRLCLLEYITTHIEDFRADIYFQATSLYDEFRDKYKGEVTPTLPKELQESFQKMIKKEIELNNSWEIVLSENEGVESLNSLLRPSFSCEESIRDSENYKQLTPEAGEAFIAWWHKMRVVEEKKSNWVDLYIEGMKSDSVYGGPIEIKAFTHLFKIPVRLFSALFEARFTDIVEDDLIGEYDLPKTIHLIRPEHTPHFDFLQPKI